MDVDKIIQSTGLDVDRKKLMAGEILVFAREDGTGLSETMNEWMSNEMISEKIFIATQHGIYNGRLERKDCNGTELNWWTFKGLTNFLSNEASL